jgi:hypothetical protein
MDLYNNLQIKARLNRWMVDFAEIQIAVNGADFSLGLITGLYCLHMPGDVVNYLSNFGVIEKTAGAYFWEFRGVRLEVKKTKQKFEFAFRIRHTHSRN